MSLHDLIQAAYPTAIPDTDYIVQDDGNGPFLAFWNIAGPIPAGVPIMAFTSAFLRWYEASAALCAVSTTQIIDKVPTPQRLRATAGIDAQVEAAAEGEIEGGVTKAQAQEMLALWDWFNAAAQEALSDPRAHGKSPVQILSELGGA